MVVVTEINLEYQKAYLHTTGYALSLTENLVEVLCAQNIPECGLGQQPGGVVGILHVGHGYGGVGDPVVHHSIHRHRHRVLGQDLEGLSEVTMTRLAAAPDLPLEVGLLE